MTGYLFSFWAITLLFSGWKVITAKNPILSVFWLVVGFASGSALLLLLGIEFLPILFVIVYVGAIAILFLFVVMLLNIKLVEISENATRYAPIGIIIGFIFLYELLYSFEPISTVKNLMDVHPSQYTDITTINNAISIADILYTDYSIYFIVSSLILLVSMIGAIVLCLYHESSVKRQDLFAQVATHYEKTIKLH